MFQKLECFKTLLNATFKKIIEGSNCLVLFFRFRFKAFCVYVFGCLFFFVFLESSSLGVTFESSNFGVFLF